MTRQIACKKQDTRTQRRHKTLAAGFFFFDSKPTQNFKNNITRHQNKKETQVIIFFWDEQYRYSSDEQYRYSSDEQYRYIVSWMVEFGPTQ